MLDISCPKTDLGDCMQVRTLPHKGFRVSIKAQKGADSRIQVQQHEAHSLYYTEPFGRLLNGADDMGKAQIPGDLDRDLAVSIARVDVDAGRDQEISDPSAPQSACEMQSVLQGVGVLAVDGGARFDQLR